MEYISAPPTRTASFEWSSRSMPGVAITILMIEVGRANFAGTMYVSLFHRANSSRLRMTMTTLDALRERVNSVGWAFYTINDDPVMGFCGLPPNLQADSPQTRFLRSLTTRDFLQGRSPHIIPN
jgi:hypothetical protein